MSHDTPLTETFLKSDHMASAIEPLCDDSGFFARENLHAIGSVEANKNIDQEEIQDACTAKIKKVKKRVGRIGFAEVMVIEQVIRNTNEDLEMRRDHWRAIQERAEDPNTIFSNDSSKAPSAHDSPKVCSTNRSVHPATPPSLDVAVEAIPLVDFELLHSRLMELKAASIANPGFDTFSATDNNSADADIRENEDLNHVLASDIGSSTNQSYGSGSDLSSAADQRVREAVITRSLRMDVTCSDAALPRPFDGVQGGTDTGAGTASVSKDSVPAASEETRGSAGPRAADCAKVDEDVLSVGTGWSQGAESVRGFGELKNDAESSGGLRAQADVKASPGVGLGVVAPAGVAARLLDSARPASSDSDVCVAGSEASPLGDAPTPASAGGGEGAVDGGRALVDDAPRPGCPPMLFPDLSAFASPKQQHAIFSAMAQGLLAYVDLWPKARKGGAKGLAQPRDAKTSRDLAYALERWLVHTWQAGRVLRNPYHMGELMAEDKELLHGPRPLIERKIVSTEKDKELSVQLAAVADISVDDWMEMATRFKNRHLIGDNFFPSEEYAVLSGLDALSLNMENMESEQVTAAGHSNAALQNNDSEKVLKSDAPAAFAYRPKDLAWAYGNSDGQQTPDLWEEDSGMGLPINFTAKLDTLEWNAPYLAINETVNKSVDTGANQLNGLCSPAKTECEGGSASKEINLRHNDPSKISESQVETAADIGLRLGRAISEPLPRLHRSSIESYRTYVRRPATSDTKICKFLDQKKNLESKRDHGLERDSDFQNFTRSKTGRTKLSERKIEMLKYAYRNELVHRKKVQAAKSVSLLVSDAGRCLQENDAIDSEAIDSEKSAAYAASLGRIMVEPAAVSSKKRHGKSDMKSGMEYQEKHSRFPLTDNQKISTVTKDLDGMNFAFERLINTTTINLQLNKSACISSPENSDFEENIDEFLRPAMRKMLQRDYALAKSLQTFSDRSNESCSHPSSRMNLHEPVATCETWGHSRGSLSLKDRRQNAKSWQADGIDSTRLPDLKTRKSLLTPIHSTQHPDAPQRKAHQRRECCSTELAGRGSSQSAFGYLERHEPRAMFGPDLLKSPYAQRVRGCVSDISRSKKFIKKSSSLG